MHMHTQRADTGWDRQAELNWRHDEKEGGRGRRIEANDSLANAKAI